MLHRGIVKCEGNGSGILSGMHSGPAFVFRILMNRRITRRTSGVEALFL